MVTLARHGRLRSAKGRRILDESFEDRYHPRNTHASERFDKIVIAPGHLESGPMPSLSGGTDEQGRSRWSGQSASASQDGSGQYHSQAGGGNAQAPALPGKTAQSAAGQLTGQGWNATGQPGGIYDVSRASQILSLQLQSQSGNGGGGVKAGPGVAWPCPNQAGVIDAARAGQVGWLTNNPKLLAARSSPGAL